LIGAQACGQQGTMTGGQQGTITGGQQGTITGGQQGIATGGQICIGATTRTAAFLGTLNRILTTRYFFTTVR